MAERRYMTDIGRICPICGNTYTARPAISRADNETEICPECGTREALAVWKIARMVRKSFVPVPGHTYCNEGGGSYKCISVSPLTGDARLRNVISGWTFDAHGVGIYPNGSIDWDWSKNGCFEEGE